LNSVQFFTWRVKYWSFTIRKFNDPWSKRIIPANCQWLSRSKKITSMISYIRHRYFNSFVCVWKLEIVQIVHTCNFGINSISICECILEFFPRGGIKFCNKICNKIAQKRRTSWILIEVEKWIDSCRAFLITEQIHRCGRSVDKMWFLICMRVPYCCQNRCLNKPAKKSSCGSR